MTFELVLKIAKSMMKIYDCFANLFFVVHVNMTNKKAFRPKKVLHPSLRSAQNVIRVNERSI